MLRTVLPAACVALSLLSAGCVGGWALPGRGGDDGVGAQLVVRIALPEAARVGEEVSLKAVVEGEPGGKLFYFWTFGDGADARGDDLADVEHAFAEGGAYPVRLVVLDGAGSEGVAEAVLPVDQAFAFEGTVSRGLVGDVGRGGFSAAVPVQADAARVTADVALDRGQGPAAGLLPGDSRVTLRFLHAANEAEGGDVLIAELEVHVPAEGVAVEVAAPGDRLLAPGDVVFEVTADEGTAHFVADVLVAYG